MKRVVQVEIKSGQYLCQIQRKQGGDREHRFYWKTVKEHASFSADPFFTTNQEDPGHSDSSHRNKANYTDHINKFPVFEVLDDEYLKNRVEFISDVKLSDAPIPRPDSYPDTDNVQLIAYHRMVRFRKFIDEALGGSNLFWRKHRQPEWCHRFLDFQVVEPEYTSIYRDLS
jgi:hypothetical protein